MVRLTPAGDEHHIYNPDRTVRGRVMVSVVEDSFVLDFEEKIDGDWVESPRYEGGFYFTLKGTEDELFQAGCPACLKLAF